MKKYKFLKIQILYILRYIIGSARFVDISLPYSKKRFLFDKNTKQGSNLYIRDIDDWIQIEHIFLREEFNLSKTSRQDQIFNLYKKIISANLKPLIIDIGANIGLASKYFDIIYPSVHILAVEPEIGNYQVAQKNISKRTDLHLAAISSQNGMARLISTGRNVGFRVELNANGQTKCVTVPDLLKNAVGEVPFLIKIDIEGFESNLFAENTEWIDLFPVLLVELHDWMLPQKHVALNFLKEISKRERDFMHFDGYVASIASDLSIFKVL